MIMLQTIFFMISPIMFGQIWLIIVYLPLLFTMIWGGITIRKERTDISMSYGHALLSVFIIATVGSLMFNIYVFRIWMHVIDPNWMDKMWAAGEVKLREQAEAKGMSDQDVDKQMDYVKSINIEMVLYVLSGICSVILSLIVAAFVRRPENDNIIKPQE